MSTDGDSSSHSVALPLILIIGLITLVAVVYSIVHDPADDEGIQDCGRVPNEATEMIETIQNDGPFDYPAADGSHFGNYQDILPQQDSDYYREYTVRTPGERGRGQRRIVTGGDTEENPEVFYYTNDHYESFCKLRKTP